MLKIKFLSSPSSEQLNTMEYLHLSHLGFANTFSLTKSRYFWEGMKADLEKFIACCAPCIKFQDCRPFELELAKDHPISAPMEWLAMDVFFIFKANIIYFCWMVLSSTAGIIILVPLLLVNR